MSTSEARRCGALTQADGSTLWRVWAPNAKSVDLVLIDRDRQLVRPMEPKDRGFFQHEESGVGEGRRYAYRLDGGPLRPDPCSLWQPDGPHQPSAVVDLARFHWTDHDWRGVAREDLVFYELHVGTFTPEGTFDAVIPRLRDLKELGITAIELMPVAQFPGTRNWGYDGVLPYAAQNSYGGPHGLHRLVNACHAHGLACFLDVVYNHVGPEGNYLAEFGPYFTQRYMTPWGSAINYDGPGSDEVRDFVLDNARMWLEEFHLDGLRLDAVHAIYDLGPRHILRSIQQVAEDVTARRGWPAHIVAESDLNDPRLLWPPERGGYGLDAQWSDDFHHAVHALLTEETQGYYQDFGTARQLAQVLECPFLYAGEYSPHRGRRHGAPPEGLTGDRFVVCIQNHDQVGNRARGDRLSTLLNDPRKLRLAASLLLLSPHLPLIFMGEEYGETNPFPFFCSFEDEPLVQGVREGRQREFSAFAWQGDVPDPQADATFDSARLSWSWPEDRPRAGLRRLYQDLLTARRQWPALRNFNERSARLQPDDESGPVLELVRGESLRVLYNLGEQSQPLPEGQILLRTEASRYGGSPREGALGAYECAVLAVE